MRRTLKGLILLVLATGIFQPAPHSFFPGYLGAHPSPEDSSKKEENLKLPSVNELENRLRTASGDEKDFKAALEYSKKQDELGDRFFNDETNAQIADLTAEYDAGKKESESRLLRKKNENRWKIFVLLAVLLFLALAEAAVLYNRSLIKRRTDRLLQSGEAKFRTLFERTGDAVFLVDEKGCMDCNRRAAEMLGLSPGDIVGHTFADFSPPTQPDGRNSLEAGKEWREIVLEKGPRQFYWRFQKKDGTPVDTMVTLAPVSIEQQTLMQSIVRDITRGKRFEEERIKAAELETAVRLAGGVAHDFNNLLGVILGNIEMAKSELSPGDNAFTYLSRMEESTRSAVELTRAFSTISEKEFQSPPKETGTANKKSW